MTLGEGSINVSFAPVQLSSDQVLGSVQHQQTSVWFVGEPTSRTPPYEGGGPGEGAAPPPRSRTHPLRFHIPPQLLILLRMPLTKTDLLSPSLPGHSPRRMLNSCF